MNGVYTIALNTFRESIRNKVFASLGLFAVGILAVVAAMSRASLNEEIRLMKDLGLFLVSTFSVVIAVFVGVNLLYQEIERKTIYTVVPKPIHRFQFLLGKYFGLAATMAVQVAFMGAVLWLTFQIFGGAFGLTMVQALWLVYVEVLVVTSVALFFSSFSTPFLSGMLTFGVFVVGRFSGQLLRPDLFAGVKESAESMRGVESVVHAIAWVSPKLSQFNVTPQVVYDAELPWGYLFDATAQGFWYAAIMLLLASVLFRIRDFV